MCTCGACVCVQASHDLYDVDMCIHIGAPLNEPNALLCENVYAHMDYGSDALHDRHNGDVPTHLTQRVQRNPRAHLFIVGQLGGNIQVSNANIMCDIHYTHPCRHLVHSVIVC